MLRPVTKDGKVLLRVVWLPHGHGELKASSGLFLFVRNSSPEYNCRHVTPFFKVCPYFFMAQNHF